MANTKTTKKKTAAAEPAVVENQTPSENTSVDTTTENFTPEDMAAIRDNLRSAVIPKYTVVIPYKKAEANGKELLFAVRSWYQNFQEDFNLVIVGDCEDWFNEQSIIYIPMDHSSDNPQINQMEALKLVLADARISSDFVWSNDDIYVMAPINITHLQILKVRDESGILDSTRFNGHYKANMNHTIEMLKDKNLPIRNYGTHTPFLFDKFKFMDVLEIFPDALIGDVLIESLYYNLVNITTPYHLNWQMDRWLLPVHSKKPDVAKFNELVAKKILLNNIPEAYSSFLEEFLEGRFPFKSIFEV